jgi:hypothetical protein
MGNIEVSIRLRPIRFAFLVRPTDRKNIQHIFEINTCLWGGKHNPIIPYFEHLPNWWSRDKHHFEKSRQIIDGYLNFFEPDFIIEAEKGLGSKLKLPEDVIVSINDFHFDESTRGYRKIREHELCEEIRGLNVFGLYVDLYNKQFKFVQHHKRNIILPQPKSKTFQLFNSCLFGSFPKRKDLAYFEKNYLDVFTPEQLTMAPEQLEKCYKTFTISPLDIGCRDIDVSYSDQTDPMIFILDANQPNDLIDFWNLRAYKQHLLAIPIQWIAELSGFCQNFAIRNHRPLPGNSHGVMIDTTFLFSRSLSDQTIDSAKQYLKVEEKGAIVFQHWYPDFWERKSDLILSPNRPVLTAKESTQNVTVEGPNRSIKFNNLSPDWVEKYCMGSCWANVIHLKDSDNKDEIATVFPSSLRNPSFPNLSFDNKHILSTTEGLTMYPVHKNWHEYWNVLDGTSAYIMWLKTQDIKAEISEAGKTLLQVMRSLQGFWGIRYISHPTIIKRLNSMACKLCKTIEETEDGQKKEYPGRTVKYEDLKKEIHEIAEDNFFNIHWKNKLLESLVKYDVIKLGLEVRCSLCDNRNWYALDSLKYTLVCENCLKSFCFPQDNPSNRKTNWSYRVIGPFTKPDYAQGAYTSTLAISFLANLHTSWHSSLTWSTSLELTLKSGKKTESDFLLWYQRRRIIENDYGAEIVFGESKSFANESFENKDLRKLYDLALEFPGSILICATMKEALDNDEKERIAKLALWGRERISSGITKAAVIVLTGTEIFSNNSLGLQYVWKQKGGKRAQLIEPAYIREDNLRVLADLTQQIYLDLPSYSEWLMKKYQKRKIRKKRK